MKKRTLESPASPGISFLAEAPAADASGEPFTAEELRRISEEISARPLHTTGETRVGLMEIDPWNLHAWWHLSPDDLVAGRENLAEQGADAAVVLRFTDLSPADNENGQMPHGRFDVEVSAESEKRYLNLWRSGKRYEAEIGLRAADGRFLSLAHSNEIATPRGGPSPELDFRRVEVSTSHHVGSDPSTPAVVMEDPLMKDLFPRRQVMEEEFPLIVPETGEPLDEPAFPALAAEPDDEDDCPAMPEANPARRGLPDSLFPMVGASDLESYSVLARTAKSIVMAETLPPLLPVVAPEMVAPASREWAAAAGHVAIARILMAAPAPRPETSVQGPTNGTPSRATSALPPAPVAIEALLAKTLFSVGAGRGGVDLSASLLIEGKAAAGHAVSLFGEAVPTGQDGHFSLRLPLSAGPDIVALLHGLRGSRS